MSVETTNLAARRRGAPATRCPSSAYDVTATTVVLGALAARDWRPMHHDYDFAVNRNGTQDIFLNTPNQAAWFERYVTDWTGPKGRLGRMKFRMKDSVFPGDRMVFTATVDERRHRRRRLRLGRSLLVTLTVDGDTKTDCTARVALPTARRRQPLDPPRRPVDPLTHAEPLERTDRWISISPKSRRCCARWCAALCARHRPLERGARDRGRPDRLPARALEAAGRARPDRPA